MDSLSRPLPLFVDDDELEADNDCAHGVRDCSLSATIHHIRLSRILAKVITEQRETKQKSLLENVLRNREALKEWANSLPPVLSGSVHPSSLIPKFRRQAIVLRIFYLNAMIMINRPLLLHNQLATRNPAVIQESTEACLSASKELSRQFIEFHKEGQRAALYWYTQNITFNALSILYIHLLRNLQGTRKATDDEEAIFDLAQEAHTSLQANSSNNAPSLRYCIVLDELRKEVQHLEAWNAEKGLPTDVISSFELGNGLGEGFRAMDSGLDIAGSLPQAFEGLDTTFWAWFDDVSTSL
jgi:hypothetical protein